jgi:hypothetical protein
MLVEWPGRESGEKEVARDEMVTGGRNHVNRM